MSNLHGYSLIRSQESSQASRSIQTRTCGLLLPGSSGCGRHRVVYHLNSRRLSRNFNRMHEQEFGSRLEFRRVNSPQLKASMLLDEFVDDGIVQRQLHLCIFL